VTVVFGTMSMGFGDSDGIIIFTSGFSLLVYKLNCCKSKIGFYCCRCDWLWNTDAT